MLNPRACVAQYEEPVFCSNNTSPLYIPGSFFHNAASPGDTHLHFGVDDDYDDENNDERGGVALPCTGDTHEADQVMTEAYRDDSPALAINDAIDEETSPSNTITPTTPASRRPSHPRLVPSNVWEDENGRRTRDTLEGNATRSEAQIVSQSGQDIMEGSSATQRYMPSQVDFIAARHDLLRRPSNQNILLAEQPFRPSEPTPTQTHAPRLIIAEEQYMNEVEEDALAVDDPRRLYDFAAFMDLWRSRSVCDTRLPRFDPGPQPSIRLSRPTQEITQTHLRNGTVDMQGIRWHLIGPSRTRATTARAMLYPTGPSTTSIKAKTYVEHSTVSSGAIHYRFRSFAPRHQAKFSHYQLRHVLAAHNRNQVFYSSGYEVKSASLACPTSLNIAMDLTKPTNSAAPFRITCLSVPSNGSSTDYSNGLLLAGGFYGEYALLDTSNGTKYSQGYVTQAYNGLVTHIHGYQDRRSGLMQAAFCSNDRKVRLMDVGNAEFTATFDYGYAINCSATSVDGRLRVLVGDSNETLLTDAERGHSIVTLKEHTDHGFACSWSQDGRYVATGAQDGNTIVWDARNWSAPLRTLPSALSCPRSLNFTDTGALVVAEDEDVVRIYDRGSFEVCQELRFFGSISGVALLDGGAELAVANADKTVGGLLTFERPTPGVTNNHYRAHATSPTSRCEAGRSLGHEQSWHDVVV